MPNIPVGENTEGMEIAGRANEPPMAGPMIVPMDQTKGITAYALATDHQRWGISEGRDGIAIRSCSGLWTNSPTMVWMTPMFPSEAALAGTTESIREHTEQSSQSSSTQRDPEVC